MSALVELTEDPSTGHAPGRLSCHLEVQPRGHPPVKVSRTASNGDTAVRGAVEDMRNVLERMFRRIDGHPGPG